MARRKADEQEKSTALRSTGLKGPAVPSEAQAQERRLSSLLAGYFWPLPHYPLFVSSTPLPRPPLYCSFSPFPCLALPCLAWPCLALPGLSLSPSLSLGLTPSPYAS